jgi:hypothetical protein
MSDTEQLFIVAAVWIVIAAMFARLVPGWWGKGALFAVLVAVPFWELPFGYLNFRKLCEDQGGLKVFETFSPQVSICASYPLETSVDQFLSVGFKVVEARDRDGRVVAQTRETAIKTPNVDGSKVASAFCVTQEFVRGLPWRIQRNEYKVVAEPSQREVARHSDFIWFGMWWQERAAPLLGRGGECRHSAPIRKIADVLFHGTN